MGIHGFTAPLVYATGFDFRGERQSPFGALFGRRSWHFICPLWFCHRSNLGSLFWMAVIGNYTQFVRHLADHLFFIFRESFN